MSVFKKFWPKQEEDIMASHPDIVPPPEEVEIKCKYGHCINGVMPGKLEIEKDGTVCDCGNVKFVAESCGCENNPHLELREKQN